ncbi:5'/3'-nucleotidase SurE [Catellatospora citrea]|uniref:5'-nucleotidase SurE n=1 Tax=Catellatospora citrea TaxID=53366 RepID=A0A8J3KB20_9ACTN|nr:5'/3'-nucleotidase SurE [Catellatospora citrea]RKE12977.1 5'-nucleotidase [Catellatospora citrea]GIF95783.1 5'/3'-nucleotidase SurE [Catellatospora citrea]
MTRVLITNDDGIEAPGLHRLALAAAKAGFDVVVAAPARDSSGASAAISAVAQDGRIIVEERELPGLDGVSAYAVTGTPAMAALIATRGAFGDPPEVVLSGINRGANAGPAVLHSGTVGAALTGAAYGCQGLAVSLDLADGDLTDDDRHWDTAAVYAVALLSLLDGLPQSTVLNLNVPDLPADQVRGLCRARFGRFGQVQMRIAERGSGFVRTALEDSGAHLEPGTDMALLADGYATVTPLQPLGEAAVDLPDLSDLLTAV